MNEKDDRPPVLLGVNVDHVATLREARGTIYPDPLIVTGSGLGGQDKRTVHFCISTNKNTYQIFYYLDKIQVITKSEFIKIISINNGRQ